MITLQQLLFVLGLSSTLLGFFWALQQTRAKLHIVEAELEQIKNALVALKSTGIGQGKRIIDVDSQLKKLEDKQHLNNSVTRPIGFNDKNYQQAAKMLSMGVQAEEIMDCCGLTRGEIQLLVQLNSVSEKSRSFH